MGLKTVQSLVSVVCEITFLARSQKNFMYSGQAQILFYLNIAVGILTVLMDLLVLCLRGGILQDAERERVSNLKKSGEHEHEQEEGEGDGHAGGVAPGQAQVSGASPLHAHSHALAPPIAQVEEGADDTSAEGAELELADVYSNGAEDRPTSFSNPMHAAATVTAAMSAAGLAPIIESGGVHDEESATSLRLRLEEQARENESMRRELQLSRMGHEAAATLREQRLEELARENESMRRELEQSRSAEAGSSQQDDDSGVSPSGEERL